MGEIPSQREIWLRSDDGSHPKEKSGQGVTDLINLDWSHPKENLSHEENWTQNQDIQIIGEPNCSPYHHRQQQQLSQF